MNDRRPNPVPHKTLISAVGQLEALNPALNSGDAYVQLALPEGELLGVQARRVGDTWRWRGCAVTATGDPLSDATELVEMARKSADRWVWPDTDPLSCIRFVHSGSRVLAWGSHGLLGGPRITFTPEITEVARLEACRHILFGALEVPALLGGRDSTMLVSGNEYWVHVTTEQAEGAEHTEGPEVDLVQLRIQAGEFIQRITGAALVEVLDGENPRCFDVAAKVGDFRLVVEASVEGPVLNLGCTIEVPADPGHGDLEVLPEGWVFLGRDALDRPVVQRGGVRAGVEYAG